MKILWFFISGILSLPALRAQNVGIGTTFPQTTLDVKGNQRVGGLSSYIKYDSATGRIEWTNANLYVPVTQALMKHSAAADGLFYNNTAPVSGQLEYRNATGNPVFFTNFTNGRGYFSGDVGIGMSTPGAKLHVRYGSSGYNGPDYFLGAVIEGDNNTYLNLLTPANRESGLLFGNPSNLAHGGIVYNHAFTPNGLQFRTSGNETRIVLTANGEVGIGTTAPAYKLHVNDGSIRAEGWNSNAATISMSSIGKFEIDAPFVSGGRFVIEQNGNVGVGITNPLYKLDIADRIRLRAGAASAGLWLNNTGNSEAAFIGMEDNTHVGLYGHNGAGWKFSMNTQTGALKVNGSEGTSGQVLRSNGTSSATWGSATNSLYNNTVQVFATDSIPITDALVWTAIPGMTYNFSLTGNAKVIVMFSVRVFPGFCLACNTTGAHVGIFVNGNLSRFWKQNINNSTDGNISATYLLQLTAGNYTIHLEGMKTGPSAYFAIGAATSANNMIIQVIPE